MAGPGAGQEGSSLTPAGSNAGPQPQETAGRSQAVGVALVVLAALSWSTAGLFPRMVSTDVFTTLFWRSLLGGLSVVLFQLTLQRGQPIASPLRLSRQEFIMSVLSGGAMVCFIAAFYFTSVADVVFIYGAFPMLTLVLSALLLRTAIPVADATCALAVALGMALILGGQASMHNAFGTLLSLVATLLFALMTIAIKRYPGAQMVKVTYTGALLAAALLAPLSNLGATSLHDMAWLWLYGFFNIGVGFGCYLLGVRRLRAVLASLICMIEIPLSPLWAYLLFDEKVARTTLWGGALTLLALLVNLAWSARTGGTQAPPPPV